MWKTALLVAAERRDFAIVRALVLDGRAHREDLADDTEEQERTYSKAQMLISIEVASKRK